MYDLQYKRLIGGLTSGMDLLLDVDVVIVIIFVEVDLHMRQCMLRACAWAAG